MNRESDAYRELVRRLEQADVESMAETKLGMAAYERLVKECREGWAPYVVKDD